MNHSRPRSSGSRQRGSKRRTSLLGHRNEDKLYFVGGSSTGDLRKIVQSATIPNELEQALIVDRAGIRETDSGWTTIGERLRSRLRPQLATRNAWQSIHWHQVVVSHVGWQAETSLDNQSLTLPSAPQRFDTAVTAAVDHSNETEGVTQRFVARTLSLPPSPQPVEACLRDTVVAVIGNGDVSQKLSQQLTRAGAQVANFPLHNHVTANRTAWQQLLDKALPKRVVIASTLESRPTATDQVSWQSQRERELMSVFWMLRDWIVQLRAMPLREPDWR